MGGDAKRGVPAEAGTYGGAREGGGTAKRPPRSGGGRRAKITPMLEQYMRIKQEHPDTLLFFRLGDFYEMFFEDAERAAGVLQIALTTRSKKDRAPVPMCGVPHHALQQYVAKLLRAGLKVAVCDQMEDPAAAKGIVKREIVRIVTPGTVTEEEYLEPKQPNYLASVYGSDGCTAVVFADLSTGEIRQVELHDPGLLLEALNRSPPAEVLLSQDAGDLADAVRSILPGATLSRLPEDRFDAESGAAWYAQVAPDSRGRPDGSLVPAAMGALLWYLGDTHRASLAHLRAPVAEDAQQIMVLDEATRRNLELLRSARGERRGSLLWVLDETQTPMGARLLRQWLLAPLTDPAAVGERLDAVEELLRATTGRQAGAKILATIGDLERLTARVAAKRVTPRDLVGLAATLAAVERLRVMLDRSAAVLIRSSTAQLDDLPGLRARIGVMLSEDPPLNPRAGGMVQPGFDSRVDELRTLTHEGKRYIGALEASERARTGIGSLKIRYNQVFGYYIEVTKPNLHLVPEDYRRKQTLANAERFVTAPLEEYEAKVLGAEERLRAREAELFAELVDEVAGCHGSLSRTSAALAVIDVLCALALVAERYDYTRPRLTRDRRLVIKEGRHPVVERVAGRSGFVPNDCLLDSDGQQLLILTGPNMAGKSTFLRQVALIALLAQVGSFVPAAQAEIGVVDRLFTRIGASDNLAGGESTFMVEMKETAGIVNQLTDRSLVVLDEIGRGTSTFDGISIAWAVAEYLHDTAGERPLVLFATHYHELTDLARTKERVFNFSVAVREWKGEVLFLRRVVPGPASQSYGIQVAQLAGVPESIIVRAKEILRNLEGGELTDAGLPRLACGVDFPDGEQLALFGGSERDLQNELAGIDVDGMTPVEALVRLHELAKKASRSKKS